MGVAPFLFAVARDVAFGDVHAADETHLAVNDAELAVVAVVHLAGEGREAHGHECLHLYASLAHAVEEFVPHVPAAHIIVDESHLHTLPCLVYQHVGHEIAQRVRLHDIRDEVYRLAGCADFVHQRGEERISVGVYVHLIVFEWQRPVLHGEELDEGLVLLRHDESFLYGEFEHRTLGEQVQAVLAYEFLLPRVLPEEEIEYYPCHWHEHHGHYPCHGLHGLTVVHEHGDYRADYYCRIGNEQYPVEVYHKPVGSFYTIISFPSSLAMVLRRVCISWYSLSSVIILSSSPVVWAISVFSFLSFSIT